MTYHPSPAAMARTSETLPPGQGHGRRPRWPVVTMIVVIVTTVLSVLQFPYPQVLGALWRNPAQIAAGQWWRLVTALFVQDDAVWQIVVVLALVAAVGVLVERVYGPRQWLLLYLFCGAVGQAFGVLWLPDVNDAGASVAGAGLVGAACAWLLSPSGPRLLRVRVWAIVWLVAGIGLVVLTDMHGPPLLLGFGLGMVLLRRNGRRLPGRPGRPGTPGTPGAPGGQVDARSL